LSEDIPSIVSSPTGTSWPSSREVISIVGGGILDVLAVGAGLSGWLSISIEVSSSCEGGKVFLVFERWMLSYQWTR